MPVHDHLAEHRKKRDIGGIAPDADFGHGPFAGHAGGIDQMPFAAQKHFRNRMEVLRLPEEVVWLQILWLLVDVLRLQVEARRQKVNVGG